MFREFSEKTTIHGLHYVGNERKTLDRIFWFCALTLSLLYCTYLVRDLWTSWQNQPISVTHDGTEIDYKDIPTPAITICPLNKMTHNDSKQLYKKFVKLYKAPLNTTLTDDEISRINALRFVCGTGFLSQFIEYKADISEYLSNADLNLTSVIHDIAPKISIGFQLNDDEKRFYPHSKIITRDGLCYTFNHWNLSKMIRDEYTPSKTFYTNTQYHHVGTSERNKAIKVLIHNDDGYTDHYCNSLQHGYKVLVHNPDEMPNTRFHAQYVPLNMFSDVVITPTPHTIDDNAKSISPHIRKCYLEGEKELQFFKAYTHKNCALECFRNVTMKHFNCSLNIFPIEDNYNLCEFNKLLKDGISDIHELIAKISKDDCDCYPKCNRVFFDANFYNFQINYTEYMDEIGEIFGFGNEESNSKLNQMLFYYSDSKFVETKIIAKVVWSDFIADCGGLLGLFMGASLLSIIEILYYLIMSFIRKCRNDKKIES